jgi:glutaredoxin
VAWRWLNRLIRPKEQRVPEIVMYTRSGCHLCEEAWQLLEEAHQRHAFTLRAVDVDADPQLKRDHGECVPVITVDGRVRFRGRVNPVLLNRLLRAAKHGG